MLKQAFFDTSTKPLPSSSFQGEGFVQSINLVNNSIILKMDNSQDANIIIKRLVSANEFDEQNITIKKISDTDISLPFEKKSIDFLSGCRCFTDEVHSNLLRLYASSVINKENETLLLDDEIEKFYMDEQSAINSGPGT